MLRIILNIVKLIKNYIEKKFLVFLLKLQKTGCNKSNVVTYVPTNFLFFYALRKEYEITLHMNIVKCVANCYVFA